MQVPAQRRGLHATLISLETSSDVPAIHFLILTCRYGKGLSREPQDMIFLCHFTKTIVGSVTQWRGARPFWGFIPRCHWQERQTGSMDQSGFHTTYGLSSVYSAEVPSWSGRDPVICRPRIPSFDLMGFPIMQLFLIHLSLFSTNKALSTLRWFLSCDKLDFFTWLSLQRLPNGFLY